MLYRPLVAMLLLGSAVAAAGQSLPANPAPVASTFTVKRTDLQRHDLGAPGYETIQARIDFEPGESAPMHSHPGEEIIYVLKGVIEYEVAGQPPVVLKAGDVLFVPANTAHAARNPGKLKGSELATYVVQKGKPLITLVPKNK